MNESAGTLSGGRLPDWVIDRRAIEALRSGVPNRDAVRALGCAQPGIEEKFRRQLAAVAPHLAAGEMAKGLLVAGDFGSGKSHLLDYLGLIALEENFVVSKVVVSKETPLHDLNKIYRAAFEGAQVPGHRGAAMTEIAAQLDLQRRECVELLTWAGHGATLNGRFGATLYLYLRAAGDPELRDRIISFWAGSPIGSAEVRQALRTHGATTKYQLDAIKQAELAFQRCQFAARLIAAAGFAGWVLLIDEVELIGRYSAKQRARSYAELLRWAGESPEGAIPGLTAVLAITSDFASAVLDQKDDRDKIPGRLRASGRVDDQILATAAERGMRWIDRGATLLRAPDRAIVDLTHESVRAIHARAYNWDPPPAAQREVLTTTRMREYIRRWINEWDLIRLDPSFRPETEVRELRIDYRESPDLEREDDPGAF